MKYRALAVLPILLTAAFAAAVLLSHDRNVALRVENEALKLLALGGCLTAALAFERGEYLRRAWGLHALCFALLLARDGLFLAHLAHPHVQGTLVLVGNLASVIGIWLMARAADEAGLELPGSPTRRRVALLIAAVVSIAITANALVADGQALASGNAGAIVNVASDAGDVLSMALIAPVLLTAIAMRGGLLRWPWGLFATSLLFWLLYDAARTVFGGDIEHTGLAWEVFRSLACTYTFSAGIAQRYAVSRESA